MTPGIHESLQTMTDNARFVLQEVESMDLEETLRSEVQRVFQGILDTIYWDVRSELAAMEEKASGDPAAAAYSNRDPSVNARLAVGWLGEEMGAMNELIQGLPEDPGLTLLRVLLQESGANILTAYSSLRGAAGTIRGS